jgi:hypothetical protein
MNNTTPILWMIAIIGIFALGLLGLQNRFTKEDVVAQNTYQETQTTSKTAEAQNPPQAPTPTPTPLSKPQKKKSAQPKKYTIKYQTDHIHNTTIT